MTRRIVGVVTLVVPAAWCRLRRWWLVVRRILVRTISWVVLLALGSDASAALEREPYIQMQTPTSVIVAWRTVEPSDSRVQFGTTLALDSEATDEAVVSDHFVELSGLTPATRYFYNIGSISGVEAGGTEDYFFKTAPTLGAAEPFSAWILGDSGSGSSRQIASRDAMLAHLKDSVPDMVLHVGDMAYPNGTDEQFTDKFFSIYAQTLKNAPVWPAMGNHELPTSDSPSQTGPYFEAFVLPVSAEIGGVKSGTEAYYSFDYANVHFIVIDTADTSMATDGAMAQWVLEDLIATKQDWIIAFFHHPPYTKGSHDSDLAGDSDGRLKRAREHFVPLLEAGGVDLVIAGHSHSYERSYLIDGVHCPSCGADNHVATPDLATLEASGHILDGGSGDPKIDSAYTKPTGLVANAGTVYVVAGHGGQTPKLFGQHPVMYLSEADNGSCLMTVDGDTLTLINIRQDGVKSDAFTLAKRASCAADVDCDDGNICTIDVCDIDSGLCSSALDDSACDDGLGCTVDTCDVESGTCSNALDHGICDDGDACTIDTCDSTSGACVGTPTCHPVCEHCDNGSCRSLCGNPSDPASDTFTVTDGLMTLRAAVGADFCEGCLCDVDSSGAVSATDALIVLQASVALPVALNCPAPATP